MSANNNNEDQVNSGIRAILKFPVVYTMFQRMMGSGAKYRRFITDYIKPSENARVLDIGCGSADILEYYPKTIEYVGYDLSDDYIDYARSKYGHRAKFYNQRVNQMMLKEGEKFDIVYAGGLIHHLSDEEAVELFKLGFAALKDDGFMFTADPAWVDGQPAIGKMILERDRGKHIRKPNHYKKLGNNVFPNIEVNVMHDIGFPARTNCVMKCFKK